MPPVSAWRRKLRPLVSTRLSRGQFLVYPWFNQLPRPSTQKKNTYVGKGHFPGCEVLYNCMLLHPYLAARKLGIPTCSFSTYPGPGRALGANQKRSSQGIDVESLDLNTFGCRWPSQFGYGSKLMIPFWGRCTTHFSLFLVGIGMFTGGAGF